MKVTITRIDTKFAGVIYGELTTESSVGDARFVNTDGTLSRFPVTRLAFVAKNDARLQVGATMNVEGDITLPFTRAGFRSESAMISIT